MRESFNSRFEDEFLNMMSIPCRGQVVACTAKSTTTPTDRTERFRQPPVGSVLFSDLTTHSSEEMDQEESHQLRLDYVSSLATTVQHLVRTRQQKALNDTLYMVCHHLIS